MAGIPEYASILNQQLSLVNFRLHYFKLYYML